MSEQENKNGNGYKELFGNYTILSDYIIEKYDIVSAGIFSKIWVLSQKTGSSFVSQKTLADYLGVSISTVKRHLEVLINNKLVIDLYPTKNGSTKNYQVDLVKLAELIENNKNNLVQNELGQNEPSSKRASYLVQNELGVVQNELAPSSKRTTNSNSNSESLKVKVNSELGVNPQTPTTTVTSKKEEIINWFLNKYEISVSDKKLVDRVLKDIATGDNKLKVTIPKEEIIPIWEEYENQLFSKPFIDKETSKPVVGIPLLKVHRHDILGRYKEWKSLLEYRKQETQRIIDDYRSEPLIDFKRITPERSQNSESFMIEDYLDEI